jgi:hypothetical protein
MPDSSDNNSGKSTFVPSFSDHAKQSPGEDSSDFHRSETWPDTVALPTKPAHWAPYQPFVLLLSMVHVILAALVLSHYTLHHT